MSEPKLKPCPFCGGTDVKIVLCDSEGNVRRADYEQDPYSGIGFMIRHVADECPVSNHPYDSGDCYVEIYGTRKEAVAAWNRRPHDGHMCCECINCNVPNDMDQSWCTHIREMVPYHGNACSEFEPNSERVTK